MEKIYLFEDEEKIYSEEEMKKIIYDFIDNQTELLKKEYFYIKLSPI